MLNAKDAYNKVKNRMTFEKDLETINFDLAMKQVEHVVKQASENGYCSIRYKVPKFIPGGYVMNSELVARQIKRKMIEYGYKSYRVQKDVVHIEWSRAALEELENLKITNEAYKEQISFPQSSNRLLDSSRMLENSTTPTRKKRKVRLLKN
jgi:hypothetical protein